MNTPTPEQIEDWLQEKHLQYIDGCWDAIRSSECMPFQPYRYEEFKAAVQDPEFPGFWQLHEEYDHFTKNPVVS